MDRTENRSHYPKGGMCTNCTKWRNDCSSLPFETMPVILTMPSGAKVVKCTEHVRSNAELSGPRPLAAEGSRSNDGLERWRFRYTIDNFGPEKLESGKKRCENDGCTCAADMIVEGQSAIFFACSQCAHLIPGANVLRSNALSQADAD